MCRGFLLLLFISAVVGTHPSNAHACFGDKLGVAYVKGARNEFAVYLITMYIKAKTGIDSVVTEFETRELASAELKKEKYDMVVLSGSADELNNEKLEAENPDSKFFTLIESVNLKVVFRVSKKRLDDIKFYTLNKVMERAGELITKEDFKKKMIEVIEGGKFTKQAAREYLASKDLL